MPDFDDFFGDDDDDEMPYWQEQRFGDIWEGDASAAVIDGISDRTGYSDDEILQGHLELFYPLVEGEDRDTQETLWEAYIEAMVNGSMDRDEFFEMMDMAQADFGWEEWRELMGY